MPTTFVTSDTHFGHSKIIDFCQRPFSSEEEMNKAMVANWNSVVTDKDTVIHIGDVGWRSTLYWAKQLNGKKILILGNHDKKMNGDTKKLFQSIHVVSQIVMVKTNSPSLLTSR